MGLYEEAALRDPEDIPTLNELALLLWDARHDAKTALQVRQQLVGGGGGACQQLVKHMLLWDARQDAATTLWVFS